jgi:hypothetical protein
MNNKSAGVLTLVLAILAGPPTARAGMDEILRAVQQSEFRFARTKSTVPFAPLGWVQGRRYASARFEDEQGALPAVEAQESTFGLGAVVPVYVARRDMLVLGGDASLDRIDVQTGPYQDQSVQQLTPVVAWLHQFGDEDLMGVFVAPIFSRETNGGQSWGTSGYGGVLAMHWFSDTMQLLYGGVYANSFGEDEIVYPYLGLMWLPSPRLAVTLVFPWPTITYAPNDRWFYQVALAPGGSSWVRREEGYESSQSLDSWNLSAGVGYRMHGNFWAMASLGVAGLRGVDIGQGGSGARLESEPGAVFTLAVQYRP